MPKVSDLFILEYGHSLELNRLQQSTGSHAINFVGRAARNNGVTGRVERILDIHPAPARTISVALSGQGGAGVAFLQPKPYYCGFHVMVLKPRQPMTTKELLWWATCITANRFRFGFGRQANRTLKDIELPPQKDMPAWVPSVDPGAAFIQVLDGLKSQANLMVPGKPNGIGLERVLLSDLFHITYGNSLELNRLTTDPKGISFVARTAKNNGVAARVQIPDGLDPITPGCISVALSGSVLESFVQQKPFVTGFHVMVLRPKEIMTTEEMMFYAVSIRTNRWRYSYGRQANRTLKDLLVPSREAVPSWVHGVLARVADQLKEALPTF